MWRHFIQGSIMASTLGAAVVGKPAATALSNAIPEDTVMIRHAQGEFEVKLAPQGATPGIEDAFAFAAPSPAYAYFAFDNELRHTGSDFDHTLASLVAALVWGAIGLVMLGLAWDRARRAIALEERASRVAERRLDDEADEDEADDELEPPSAPPLPGAPS